MREADGRWITTKTGAHIFIGDNVGFDSKQQSQARIIKGKITNKGFDAAAADKAANEIGAGRSIVPVDEKVVIEELSKLPESHQNTVDKIVIESKPAIASFTDKDNQIVKGLKAGELTTNLDTGETKLTLYPTMESKFGPEVKRERQTVRHEVGHAVYNQLNTDTQKEWKTMHYMGYKPTEYASTNSRENFTEHYRLYSDGGEGRSYVESHTTPAQVLYRDGADNDVPEDKAVKKGKLYYLNDNHDIVAKEQASVWTITWYDIKTGDFLGDTWGQVIQK